MINNEEKPIERVMETAFSKIKSLIDADTVIGSPITTNDGFSIIPISKITMGFITGGGEYSDMSRENYTEYPFAGGSGTGMSISPVGFLVSDGKTVKIITMDEKGLFDKLLSSIPEALEKILDGVSDIKNGKAKRK